MPYTPFRTDDVSVGLPCSRGQQPKPRCWVCGEQPGTQRCDGVIQDIPESRTCDRPLCRACTVHVPPDLDYCPDYSFDVTIQQGELFP
jgi:hypothetical protein